MSRTSFWILAAAIGWYAHDVAHSQTGTTLFVDGETPSGIIDGKNRTFRLASSPIPPSSLHLYRNGLRQRVEADFTLSTTGVITTGECGLSQFMPWPRPKPTRKLTTEQICRIAGIPSGYISSLNPNYLFRVEGFNQIMFHCPHQTSIQRFVG